MKKEFFASQFYSQRYRRQAATGIIQAAVLCIYPNYIWPHDMLHPILISLRCDACTGQLVTIYGIRSTLALKWGHYHTTSELGHDHRLL